MKFEIKSALKFQNLNSFDKSLFSTLKKGLNNYSNILFLIFKKKFFSKKINKSKDISA
jgi:hypothetical protein